jgi:hypothetical protein
MESSLSSVNGAILEAIRAAPSASAVLLRRVDPRSGAVVSWSLAPSRPTSETHVHLLPEHRVVLVNDGVQWLDGATGVMRDAASFKKPSGWFWTEATRDGRVVVVRTLAPT